MLQRLSCWIFWTGVFASEKPRSACAAGNSHAPLLSGRLLEHGRGCALGLSEAGPASCRVRLWTHMVRHHSFFCWLLEAVERQKCV
jgi:hypothetical protein